MNLTFLDHRRIRQLLTLLLLAGALTCMFPPKQSAFEWWAAHAVGAALGYLALGLFFLSIDRTRLMLVCFGCSAAISFYYHESGQLPVSDVLYHLSFVMGYSVID